MTEEMKNNNNGKKYLVIAMMILVFTGSMWLIFAPSETDRLREKKTAGFNADIPDPKNTGMIDDKKTAYEQEQMRLRHEQKMRTLQDYSFNLSAADDNTEKQNISVPADLQQKQTQGGNVNQGRRDNSFEASNSAYRDINRTLGNFYEKPKEDPEKEELRRQVEELKSTISQQQTAGLAFDDQVALLEKSYELAAKYMPGGQNVQSPAVTPAEGTERQTGKNDRIQAVSVSEVIVPVVSALWQPITDSALLAGFSGERNGFYTAVGGEERSGKNTIKACVHNDQTVTDGQSVKLRLLEQMQAGTSVLPRNAIVTGVCRIQGERLVIAVTSLEYNGLIIPVELTVYDNDGQEGVFIPGSMEIDAAKEVTANLGQNLGTTVSITNQSAGGQLLSELGKGAVQGASQYISKKMRVVKVHLKAGYNVMLYRKKN